ncbi:hypothetical protein BC332_31538 [Capsicum chinense]|nr:hypothetical protein BC332_31538 [Capsicum chinense]
MDYIAKLMKGCPELESMELQSVECFNRLKIYSLKLKRLYLEDIRLNKYDPELISMEIFAPCLQDFRISAVLGFAKFRILDMSSLISANLSYFNSCSKRPEEDCQNDHRGFVILVLGNLQKLSCATELTLGYWFTEVVHMLQLKGVSIPELKCKYLTLKLDEEFSLDGAAGILRAMPHVETLNMDVFTRFVRCRCDFELRCLAERDSIDLQSWISSFEFPNLKNVAIVHPSVMCSTCFLLKNFQARLRQAFQTFRICVKECTSSGEVCDGKGKKVQGMFKEPRVPIFISNR